LPLHPAATIIDLLWVLRLSSYGRPYIFTIWIAFTGQARTQSPQPWQREGCGMGIWCGASCLSSLWGQPSAATQIPPSHLSGLHLSKSTRATLLGIGLSLWPPLPSLVYPPVAARLPKFQAKLGVVQMIRRKETSRMLLFENLRVAIEKDIIFFRGSNGYPDETRR
jgi:hypothetical protein